MPYSSIQRWSNPSDWIPPRIRQLIYNFFSRHCEACDLLPDSLMATSCMVLSKRRPELPIVTKTLPEHFLTLPPEIRLLFYKHTFKDFTLHIEDDGYLYLHAWDPKRSINQICRVNKQIRDESLPILASSLKLVCSSRQRTPDELETRRPAEVVTPKLNSRFSASIRSLSLSLSSQYIPDYTKFPQLRKIAVDAWFSEPAITKTKDADLVDMVRNFMADTRLPGCCYPEWLKWIYENAPPKVALAIQEVWTVEGKENTEKSHVKALINLRAEKVEHRKEGGKSFEMYDTAPADWSYY